MDEVIEVIEAVEDGGEVQVTEEVGEEVDLRGELDALRGEISGIRGRLEEREAIYERASAEVGEFIRLFPNVSLSEIPKSVWEMARGGVPLAAAYAYSEAIRRRKEDEIAEADRRGRAESAGALMGNGADFYSPDEVRRMSPGEVKANFKKINESMKKWR